MSTPASVLCELAREVRKKTLQILDATRPRELIWAPPGTSNHILWHAGHALWLQDVLCLQQLGGVNGLPDGWEEMFGMNSRPALQKRSWPGKGELRRQLQAQLPRLLDAIGAVREADLGLPPSASRGDTRTLGQCILHGLHDEANHQGEMYLLLKMQRLGPA